MANWLPLKSERRIRESPFSCFVCVSLPRERSSTSGRFYRQRKPVEFLRLAVQPTVEPVAKSERRMTCNREPKPYLDLGTANPSQEPQHESSRTGQSELLPRPKT